MDMQEIGVGAFRLAKLTLLNVKILTIGSRTAAPYTDASTRRLDRSLRLRLWTCCGQTRNARWKSSRKCKVHLPSHHLHCLTQYMLGHRHIVKLVDVFHDSRHYYIVTELMRGGLHLLLFHVQSSNDMTGELLDRIQRQKGFSEQHARDIFTQIVGAVDFLHARHIVHRDIKAENLMFETLDDNSDLKLVDFGFAREMTAEHPLKTPLGTVAFVQSQIMMNVSNLMPEHLQARGS